MFPVTIVVCRVPSGLALIVGNPSRTKPCDFTSVRTDGFGAGEIVGGLLGDDAGGRKSQLGTVAAGVAEWRWQALTHTHHLLALIYVRVHTRRVRVQLRSVNGRG